MNDTDHKTLAVNSRGAWAIGKATKRGFHIRRIVWGRLLARHERRPDEEIRKAILFTEKQRALDGRLVR